MKKVILFLMMFVFTAGFVTSAAYAFGCPYKAQMAASSMDSDMPCHDDNTQKESCEGLCLCLHLSINQTITLQDDAFSPAPDLAERAIFVSDKDVRAPPTAALFRPPITAS